MIIKKIFALVSEKHFYMFRKRAYDAKMTLGEALTRLAEEFAEGRIELNRKRPAEERKKVTNFYLKKREEAQDEKL